MKVLIIAPHTGGIDIYTKSLSDKLKSLGVDVEIGGGSNTESAYDASTKKWKSSEEVKNIVNKIAQRIPFGNFDLIAFNYGKNDIEQYLPVVIRDVGLKIPRAVYFVHFLSRNLFGQYLNDDKTQREVEAQVVNFYDGYVFFGTFAKEFMEEKYNKKFNGIVNYLPETHSLEKVPDPEPILKEFHYSFRSLRPTIYLPGFAANYKDHRLLLSSFKYVKRTMNFIFAGPGWRKRLGFREKKIGSVNVWIVDKYLSPQEYHVLTNYSLFGVFPYRQPEEKGEYFQGSGTLPNFIYAHKGCIVLNEGAMGEYIGKAGIAVNNDEKELGEAINKMLDSNIRARYEEKAAKRAHLFSLDEHARKCFNYFQKLV